QYDLNGNLTRQQSPRGQANDLVYSYDDLDRVASKQLGDPAVTTYTYSYDDPTTNGTGRLARVSRTGLNTVYGYDLRGNVTNKPRTFPEGHLTFQYAVDEMGRIRTTTYPDTEVVDRGYDGIVLNRFASHQNGTLVDQIALSDAGQVQAIHFAQGDVWTN